MTKYILFGGADRTAAATQKAALAAEIQKDIKEPLKILSVLFAEKREDWEAKYDIRKAFFAELFGNDFELQFAMPASFEAQAKWANVIYLHGGDTALLKFYLDTLPNLRELFKDKTVIGSSAGAEYLSATYWTPDWREVKSGRGLVDAKVIAHYKSAAYGADDPRGAINWPEIEAALEQTGNKTLPIYRIKEGEFVVVQAGNEHDNNESHYNLADYPELNSYLHREKAATIAVPIDEAGTIHAASLLYYHTEKPLAFYFVTNKNTEKCRLLKAKQSLKAACTIGTQKGVDFTLQMRGELAMIEPEETVVKAYYQKRGNHHDDINEPGVVCLRFTPNWTRFTDYSRGYEHYFLEI